MKNLKNVNTENLEENGENLEFNGKIIAAKIIDWGWTKFFASVKGDGFGTIRNTGFAYYKNADAFKAEAQALGGE